jgi:hypothetical protein
MPATAFSVGLAPPGGPDNSIPGNVIYTPSVGTVLPLGNQTRPVLNYGGGSFVYSVKSQRSQVLNLLKPSGPLFGGHNLVAFTATLSATTSYPTFTATLAREPSLVCCPVQS